MELQIAEVYCNGVMVRRQYIRSQNGTRPEKQQIMKRLFNEVTKAAKFNPENIYWVDLKRE